jgi:hypothetical protein
MALDEPKDNDKVFEVDGFTYLVEQEFIKKASPIKVDFSYMGFKLDSAIDLGAGCGSCGTKGSCCS